MPNMSYCMFRNTVDDLNDCRNLMEGLNEHYQSRKDLSDGEGEALDRMIEICRAIVRMDDNDNHVFVIEDEDDS